MNAVEIEQAISDLAIKEFDGDEFPYAFLESFGNKETTLKRLRSGSSNKSDIGGVLQANNVHIFVSERGQVTYDLARLKESTATSKSKARYIVSTDGVDFEAEDIDTGETVACAYQDFPNHFGFFLPLAGISTIQQVRESSFDIRATSRLNRLYVELLKDNPEWGNVERRPDMNHFMARLIFCFFAEDTEIFFKNGLFSDTISQLSDRDSSNTHEVIGEIFRAMNTKRELRSASGIKRWADVFPYVNGGLFSGTTETPKFSKIARTYLLHTGSLDWTKINPDIFGSMIQAVTDEEERGSLGMHYTSVPNILKVLNPLFLDDLRAKLEEAGDNPRTLLNLRKRISRIRVFDPACGSGNFLVIAYKQMREIENKINERRNEGGKESEIPLTNFRGIELKDFPAEVARLALIIAEYQCDLVYRGQKNAIQDFLPLAQENWITCGNALLLDWLSICPPVGSVNSILADDLFDEQSKQQLVKFENEGGETFICGNPPFTGTRKQSPEQKKDLERLFSGLTKQWGNVDYVGAWFLKAAQYNKVCDAPFSFVATNSICQGQQVPITWDLVKKMGHEIRFAYTPFKWSNLASNKAGVTVVIVGVDKLKSGIRAIYTGDERVIVDHVNPYLTSNNVEIVHAEKSPIFSSESLKLGVYYSKSAGLMLTSDEAQNLKSKGLPSKFIRQFLGSQEFINGSTRYCLWISDDDKEEALSYSQLAERVEEVKRDRLATVDKAVQRLAEKPYQFREFRGDEDKKIFVPIVSSESRKYFPAGIVGRDVVPTNKAFYVPTPDLSVLAIILSRIHLVWIGTICGRLEMRYSYSNTLGWNTFPIPSLTEKNKLDLAKCAEDILIAREAHFPASIADLYDPDAMPSNLREAHDRNDEVLERIYIGRRFRNDTERLEKLFDLYTEMTATKGKNKSKAKL